MATLNKLTIIKFLPLLGINFNYAGTSKGHNGFNIQPLHDSGVLLNRLGVVYKSINDTFRSSISKDNIERIVTTINEMEDFCLYFSISYDSLESYYLADLPLSSLQEKCFFYEGLFSKKNEAISFNKKFNEELKGELLEKVGKENFSSSLKKFNSTFAIIKVTKKSFLDVLSQLEITQKPWLLDIFVDKRVLECKYELLNNDKDDFRIVDSKNIIQFQNVSKNQDKIQFVSKTKIVASPLEFNGKSLKLEAKEGKVWSTIKNGLPSPSVKNLRFEDKANKPYWFVYL